MRFLSLLASATLFGGMILFSFGFAPLVFKTLDVGEAGRMLRQAFPWYYLFVLAIAALGAALLFSVDQSSSLVMVTIASIALYTRQGLMPQINSARDQQVGGNLVSSKRFRRLHGVAVLNLGPPHHATVRHSRAQISSFRQTI